MSPTNNRYYSVFPNYIKRPARDMNSWTTPEVQRAETNNYCHCPQASFSSMSASDVRVNPSSRSRDQPCKSPDQVLTSPDLIQHTKNQIISVNPVSKGDGIFLGYTSSVIAIVISTIAFLASFQFLIFALMRYDWSDALNYHMSLSSAQTLCGIGAKMIEIFFVTAYVAAISQYFCRAAYDQSRGVSWADLNIRGWIAQPGSLISDSTHLKESGLTFIGLSTLLATLGSLFYTTACGTLVSPTDSMGEKATVTMVNTVRRTSSLETVMTGAHSSIHDLSDSSQGLMDFSRWVQFFNISPALTPFDIVPTTRMNWNINMRGTWISSNYTSGGGKPVDNATLIYPHPAVVSLLLERENIRQFMVDYNGFLQMSAGVKAPAINTLCTTVPTAQIELWNKLHMALTDENGISKQYDDISHSAAGVRSAQAALEKLLASKEFSALDDLSRIFGWKFPYEYPPRLITGFFNTSDRFQWQMAVPFSRAAVNEFASQYVQVSTGLIDLENLMVCKLTPKMVDGCVSSFSDGDGYGEMFINCENDEPMSAQVYNDYARGWVNSAPCVIESVLGLVPETFSAGNAAMSLMSQYLDEVYNPKNLTYSFRPSLAEMLCLITGPISVSRSENTSLHQILMPEDNHKLPFNESVQVDVEYSTFRSTGSVQKWQYILFVPLVSLCIQSAIVLIYLVAVLRCKRLRDVAEPQYLFQIGLATPFGKATNAEGIDQKFGGRWAIAKDGSNLHIAQPVQRRSLARFRGKGDRAPSYRQANQREPKDLEEGGDGVAQRVPPVRNKGVFA